MKNCVGVCSDGADATITEKSGVITRIKQLAPECASTHCFVHRESLVTKKLSTKLNDVLCEVKIVSYIKGSAVNSRLLPSLFKTIIQDYSRLLPLLRNRAGYRNNLLFYSCPREALGPSPLRSPKSTQNKLCSCI